MSFIYFLQNFSFLWRKNFRARHVSEILKRGASNEEHSGIFTDASSHISQERCRLPQVHLTDADRRVVPPRIGFDFQAQYRSFADQGQGGLLSSFSAALKVARAAVKPPVLRNLKSQQNLGGTYRAGFASHLRVPVALIRNQGHNQAGVAALPVDNQVEDVLRKPRQFGHQSVGENVNLVLKKASDADVSSLEM